MFFKSFLYNLQGKGIAKVLAQARKLKYDQISV